jgi:hypothetical protein
MGLDSIQHMSCLSVRERVFPQWELKLNSGPSAAETWHLKVCTPKVIIVPA